MFQHAFLLGSFEQAHESVWALSTGSSVRGHRLFFGSEGRLGGTFPYQLLTVAPGRTTTILWPLSSWCPGNTPGKTPVVPAWV